MELLEYLSVVRRRWLYVAVGALVGAVFGFATAPGASGAPTRYQGVHTLLVNTDATTGQTLNIQQAALLVESGAVPVRVAKRLEAAHLVQPLRVRAEANVELRSMVITATASTPKSAEAAANASAEELIAELTGESTAIYTRDLKAAQARAADLLSQLQKIDAQIADLGQGSGRSGLESQRTAIANAYQDAQSEVRSRETQGPPGAPLRTLEKATGKAVSQTGWRIPESRPARGVLLGLFGLLVGIGGAFAADRLDVRVRDKADAERSFDLPVIAEIPPLPTGSRGTSELLAATRPSAPFVEAYRALRSVVLFSAATAAANDTGSSNGAGRRRAQVVMLTSPSAGEGKTTSAAHLAAMLAEAGKRVLVVSADFRRPRIHELFDVAREPGISDVLGQGAGVEGLAGLQLATPFDGVCLLASGKPVANPANLLRDTAALITAARQLFDYVVVDTAPLLVANDATELAGVADMVIVLARAGRTSRDLARRSTEVLRRIEAPLLGVVVVAAHDTPTAYGYYRNRYYSEADAPEGARGLFRRRAERGAASTDQRQPVAEEL